ncbi:MAG TPA: right-handed parallel beta-helix repeat-containing protein, partial [Acidimicrobiales bacterium]|nr:right-handed parallel beta-helix repeat-containing protein [Acidimicrobiales bacterium]
MHGGSITGQPGLRLITRHRVRRAAAILSATAVTCGIALAGAAPARAAGATTITVTGFTDNTDACSGSSPTVSCPSLRSAVTYANGNEQSGPFTVNLAAGHYSLTLGPGQENGGPLAVQDSTVLTISGPGSASTVVEASALRSTTLSVEDGGTAAIQGVTIDGGSGPVSAGVIDNFGDLTISGSTISGGMDEGAGGGGIYNEFHGTLHIQSGTVLTGNVATSGGSGTGGALHNAGTADVTGATISGNSSGGSGAGIFNGTDAQLGLTDTTVSGNAAGGNGGGIYNDGTLTVTGGQVSGNQADDSTGGGVYNDSHGSLTITGATVSGNSADQGGGVYNVALLDGTTGATVSGSTISGNGTSSNGAGVANTGDLTVTGSTIAGNSAGGKGGGVYNSGTLTMLNSTLARNTIQPEAGATALFNDTEGTANLSFDTLADNPGATGTSTLFNNGTAHVLSSILAYAPGRQCAGSAIDDAGSNVFGDSTCDSEAQVIADPHLLPLSQNGTSVPETMAIFSTDASPSKALGTSTGTCKDLGGQTVTSDEVGSNRRPRAGGEGGLCDAGAFQLQSD